MNREKAFSPAHVALQIGTSNLLAIDGRQSMWAKFQLKSIQARVSSQEEGGRNGDTGVCNVGLLLDTDKPRVLVDLNASAGS